MSTFMANKGNIERKWYVIDAAGKPFSFSVGKGYHRFFSSFAQIL